MKYLSGWVSGSLKSHCAVETEKAIGLACWNGCRGWSGREWVEFFPKSQIKVTEDKETERTQVLIPYWLWAKKGLYTNHVCDVNFDADLVEV